MRSGPPIPTRALNIGDIISNANGLLTLIFAIARAAIERSTKSVRCLKTRRGINVSLNLLLAEDDTALAETLADALAAFGYMVTVAEDGRAALTALSQEQFDAVVLDSMMPKVDGVSLLRKVRDGGLTLPVIMLTAPSQSSDKTEELDARADHYLAKPVTADELNAWLSTILRGRSWSAPSSDTLRVGDIVVSPTRFRAWRGGTAIDLSKHELNLLVEFVRNADSVLTRKMLVECVWGCDSDPKSNVVDASIRRLRKKLIQAGGDDPILTVRGTGYMLRG